MNLKLDGIPSELLLLLNLINQEDKELPILNDDIDWKLFYKLAGHHRVFPLLKNAEASLNRLNAPPKLINIINHEYEQNTFKMLMYTAEMIRINKSFKDKNIPLLMLKGPLLGEDLYGSISMRTCSDLDMLTNIDCLNQANDLLESLGYQKDEYIKTVLNDWRWRHHHFTYYHKERGVKIEIHWRLNPGPGKEPKFKELWKRKRVSFQNNNPINLLSKEDLLYFLLTHGARHGWSRLRWLIDIKQIIGREDDWDSYIRLLRKFNAKHIGGMAAILISDLLHIKPPKEFRKLSNKNSEKLAQATTFYFKEMVSLHNLPLPIHISRYHRNYLFTSMSQSQRYKFILSFLYPYPEDAETFPLPLYLHFCYFPLRPILFIIRKFKKQAISIRGES